MLRGRRSYTETVRSYMKTAFVFPGQGSQYVGMGKSLAEKFAAARAIFDQADQALGFSLTQLCFEGPAETLQLTENMQPALLTVSVAAWRVLEEQNVQPGLCRRPQPGRIQRAGGRGIAGFRRRGAPGAQARPIYAGGGAGGRGRDGGVVEAACRKARLRILAEASQGEVVTAANYNSPDQVVIAGHAGRRQASGGIGQSGRRPASASCCR